MYAGQIIEAGPSEAVFARPAHPYTIGLQNAFPDLGDARQDLISLPGSPPAAGAHGEGCRFAPRCPFAQAICRACTPPAVPVSPGVGSYTHVAACHFTSEAGSFRLLGAQAATWDQMRRRSPRDGPA